jgi:hypothetical protein
MRKLTVCLSALALAGTCFAQQWDLGVAGGFGVYKNLTVTRNSGEATTGFKPGPVVGVFTSQNISEHLGGQLRYTLGFSDMKLSSGGTETTFAAQTHAVHYDVLLFGAHRDAKVRPFVAGGGGVKFYRGTGTEQQTQPLAQFAILSKTSHLRGLISVGGGVKVKVGARVYLSLEARDYITPAPTKVITPFIGSKLNGWMHEFTPMLGVSVGF